MLNAHVVQFLYHGVGVGSIGGVELPFALFGPVEGTHHDDIDGQTTAFVFPGHLQQLLTPLGPRRDCSTAGRSPGTTSQMKDEDFKVFQTLNRTISANRQRRFCMDGLQKT